MDNKRRTKIILSLLLVCACNGCGVKGDPVPPGTPAEIGRGAPTYRNATRNIRSVKDPLPTKKQTDETQEEPGFEE